VVTAFSHKAADGTVSVPKKAPKLVVSSTSWTLDEDFTMLADALPLIDKACQEHDLRIVLAITGKDGGTQQKEFLTCVEQLTLQRVRVKTLFLPFEDYPRFLGSADLGLCLHKSSSKYDLPMKVVDMFGAGLPAVCIRFPTLVEELLEEGKTGYTFTDAAGLAAVTVRLLSDPTALKTLKLNLERRRKSCSWRSRWNSEALPVFETLAHGRNNWGFWTLMFFSSLMLGVYRIIF